MAEYVVTNGLGAGTQQPLTTSYKTIIALTAQTADISRFRIYEMIFGTNGAPADNYIEWDVVQQTAAGTATVIVPNPCDPADGPSGILAVANATAEGTITALSEQFYLGLNQRASFRWQESTPSRMLIAPAVNLTGLAIRARSGAYTGTVTLTVKFME